MHRDKEEEKEEEKEEGEEKEEEEEEEAAVGGRAAHTHTPVSLNIGSAAELSCTRCQYCCCCWENSANSAARQIVLQLSGECVCPDRERGGWAKGVQGESLHATSAVRHISTKSHIKSSVEK